MAIARPASTLLASHPARLAARTQTRQPTCLRTMAVSAPLIAKSSILKKAGAEKLDGASAPCPAGLSLETRLRRSSAASVPGLTWLCASVPQSGAFLRQFFSLSRRAPPQPSARRDRVTVTPYRGDPALSVVVAAVRERTLADACLAPRRRTDKHGIDLRPANMPSDSINLGQGAWARCCRAVGTRRRKLTRALVLRALARQASCPGPRQTTSARPLRRLSPMTPWPTTTGQEMPRGLERARESRTDGLRACLPCNPPPPPPPPPLLPPRPAAIPAIRAAALVCVTPLRPTTARSSPISAARSTRRPSSSSRQEPMRVGRPVAVARDRARDRR